MAHSIIPYPRSAVGKSTIIYGLCDPDTGELRYVGKTILRLRERWFTHISAAKRGASRYYSGFWIRSLLDKGKRPEIFEIETVAPYADWQEAEMHWIAVFKSLGFALTNCSTGGDGGTSGVPRTEEWKKNISLSQIGKIVSAETRRKISIAGKGRPIPPEAAAKSAATRKGMKKAPCSQEHKDKLSALYKGKPGRAHTDEAKRKISEAHKGRKHTVENIEKQREIMKALWADPAYREKNLAARKVRPSRQESPPV